jgi:uncharacterized protein (DUF305 family)
MSEVTRQTHLFIVLLTGGVAAACQTASPQPGVAIVQPGAPGESSRVITAAAAADLSHVSYTPADVRFMQGMIAHHGQAVDMVDLIDARTARDEIRMLGRRIAASQVDEITVMQDWLKSRSQPAPDAHTHEGHDAALMPGMLTRDEMARLAAARGTDFDRLFLEGMIKHHGGALTMVEQLFSTPGGGQEVEVFSFASDVDADQRIEIDRMAAMLDGVLKELHR